MDSVRIYEIPRCTMAASGCVLFGEGPLERFSAWFSARPATMFPRDFLWYDAERGGFVWYYMLSEGESAPSGFGSVDFAGGLYAVATGPDQQPSDDVHAAIDAFIAAHPGLERDDTRAELGNIVTSPAACAELGYHQMDYYVPVRAVQPRA